MFRLGLPIIAESQTSSSITGETSDFTSTTINWKTIDHFASTTKTDGIRKSNEYVVSGKSTSFHRITSMLSAPLVPKPIATSQ